jgi:cell division transport system permease protein
MPFILEGALAAGVGAVLAGGFIPLIMQIFVGDYLSNSMGWMDTITTTDAFSIMPVLVIIALFISTLASSVTLRKYMKI